MKTIVILADGAADEPIVELGNKTPLQAANKPYIDLLAAKGKSGELDTIPEGFKPGSEIANVCVLGYGVPKVFAWALIFFPMKWRCDAILSA